VVALLRLPRPLTALLVGAGGVVFFRWRRAPVPAAVPEAVDDRPLAFAGDAATALPSTLFLGDVFSDTWRCRLP